MPLNDVKCEACGYFEEDGFVGGANDEPGSCPKCSGTLKRLFPRRYGDLGWKPFNLGEDSETFHTQEDWERHKAAWESRHPGKELVIDGGSPQRAKQRHEERKHERWKRERGIA